jgi:hypothetical protein
VAINFLHLQRTMVLIVMRRHDQITVIVIASSKHWVLQRTQNHRHL